MRRLLLVLLASLLTAPVLAQSHGAAWIARSTKEIAVLDSMFTSAGDFGVPPYAADPFTCTAAGKGAIYYKTADNHVYFCNGTSWTAMDAGAGANTALSNLASVAINTALLPGAVDSVALGSTSLPFTIGYFGESSTLFGAIGWNKNVTNHGLTIQTDSTNRTLSLIDKANIAFNYAAVNANTPTLKIFSAAQNTTQWLSLTHDGTNGVIDVGTGSVGIKAAGGTTKLAVDVNGIVAVGGTWAIGGNFSSILYNGGAYCWSSQANVTSSSSCDASLTRSAAAVIQIGAVNAASPVAQTFQAQGSRGATDTNTAGGNLTVASGVGTGNSVPAQLNLTAPGASATSGTAAQTMVTKIGVGWTKVVGNNSATTVAQATVATNTVAAGIIHYVCEVFDGTDLQVEEGNISYHLTNKASAFANNTTTKYGNQQAATSGTIAVTWTLTAANPSSIQVNCNSSLTPSTGYPRISYDIVNLTQQAVIIQ